MGIEEFIIILDVSSVEYKVDRVALGEKQRHPVCTGDP